MSRIASDANAVDSVLPSLYAPIAAELAKVEDILRKELRNDYPHVDELLRYGCLLGGKRLRPTLLLLSGKATGTLKHEHLVLAAVVEMIHTATLVHDDVLDEAEMRRHLATVNSRWDTKTSVLLGDYLFTHAVFLASGLRSTEACRAIGRATNVVCEGELRQKAFRGDFALGQREYLEIIAAKTAELCACSCYLGAAFSGAKEDRIERMDGYGRDLGIAFQIIDDILDLKGDESIVGKSLGTDLEQQKPTLPVIHMLKKASASERREILAILNGESGTEPSGLMPFLQRHDALEYSYEVARRFAQRSRERLSELAPSHARESLGNLADFVVTRLR
ncbi:MAG: polyprenyl synthetase family protein [Pirellulaceae bacterium]